LALDPNSQEARQGLAKALEGRSAPSSISPERRETGADSPELQRARQALSYLDRLPPSPPSATAPGWLLCELVVESSVKYEPYRIGSITGSVFWSVQFVARESGRLGDEFGRTEKIYVHGPDPARTPELSAAVEALTVKLMRTGWEPFARGKQWYSYRLRRPGQ
jgi:hypothetical protein